MRSFAINDPEKVMCSKVPRIGQYPGVIQEEVIPK